MDISFDLYGIPLFEASSHAWKRSAARTVVMPPTRQTPPFNQALPIAWPSKSPFDLLDFSLDCNKWLAGDLLVDAVPSVEVDASLSLAAISVTDGVITVWLGDGSPGPHTVVVTFSTQQGRTEEQALSLFVLPSADIDEIPPLPPDVIGPQSSVFGRDGSGTGPYSPLLLGPGLVAHSGTLWIDTGSLAALSRRGGTMLGPLILYGDPTQPLEAATKQYVDAADLTNRTLITAEQNARATADTTLTNNLATETNARIAADTTINTTIAALPANVLPLMDGAAAIGVSGRLARQDHVHPTDTTLLPKAGGTMTGALHLGANVIDGSAIAFTGGTLAGLTSIGITGAGTALSVTNNATVGGTLVVTGTLQGQATVTVGTNTATAAVLTVNGAVGNQRRIDFQTAGSLRARLALDATAESGSNAGSVPTLNVYSDTGTLVGTAWSVSRATMQSTFPSLRLGATFTYAGTAPNLNNAPVNFSSSFSGNTNGSGWVGLANYAVNTDTLDVGASQQAIGFQANQNFGGTGMTGGRSGIRWSLIQTGAIASGAIYQAGLFSTVGQFSAGGTDLAAGPLGSAFGAAVYTRLGAGATNWRGVVGMEIDYGIDTGATGASNIGLQVIKWSTHAVAPPVPDFDAMFRLADQTGAIGSAIGHQWGGMSGQWPISSTGALMQVSFTGNYATVPMTAAHGIDLLAATMSTTQFRAAGMSVLSDGTVQVGNVYLSSGPSGSNLDAKGSYVSAVASIATGGANLVIGTPLIHDATGTILLVSAVSGGAVTGVTIYRTGYAIAPPSNPVTFRAVPQWLAAAPTNPTINLTWTAQSSLALQPSGGATTIGGTLAVAGASTLSGTLAVTGATTLAGALTLSAAGTALSVTNNATIGGTLGVAGLTTATGGLTVPNGAALTTGTTATTTFNNIPTLAGGALVNATKSLTFQSGGILQINASTGVSTTMANTGNFLNAVWALSGSTLPALGANSLTVKSQYSGTMNNANDVLPVLFQMNLDNLACSGGAGVNSVAIYPQIGPLAAGSRRALDIAISPTAAVPGGIPFLTAVRTMTRASFNLGGTSGNQQGDLFGANFNLWADASYLGGINGVEVDLKSSANAVQMQHRLGFAVHVNTGSPTQGARVDSAFEVSMDAGVVSDAGLLSLLQLGKDNAGWPIDPVNGWLLLTKQQSTVPQLDASAIRPQAAAGGFDLWSINFGKQHWRSTGVALADNTTQIGPLSIAAISGGAQINASGTVGSIGGVANAGGSYKVNDALYDGLGGIINVDTINAGGGITAAHYLTNKAPFYFGVGPATVTPTGGSGNGLAVLNVTWTAASSLALQPSAGATTVGGTLGVAGATTLTGTVSGAGITALLAPYALSSAIPLASSTNPLMNGTVAIGTGTTWARADHVHPSDTSRLVDAPVNTTTAYGRKNAAWTPILEGGRIGSDVSFDLDTIGGTTTIQPYTSFLGGYQIVSQAAGLHFPPTGGSLAGFVLHGFGANPGWQAQLFMGTGSVTVPNLFHRWMTNQGVWSTSWARIITDQGGTITGALTLSGALTISGAAVFSGPLTLPAGTVTDLWMPLFGTGADGAVTVTTSVNLSRDMHYTNLTISGAGAINPLGYRIFVSGTLDLSAAGTGAIARASTPGVNATVAAGAVSSAGNNGGFTVGGTTSTGGTGGTGNTTTGTNPTVTGVTNNCNGGDSAIAGGGGAGVSAGGPGGVASVSVGGHIAFPTPTNCPLITSGNANAANFAGPGNSSNGGGQGGGDGTNAGGGGGSGTVGGGVILICARTIARGTNATAGIISAKGGKGGNGAPGLGGNAGGGGGGSGSGGGWVYIVCETLTGSVITGAIDVSSGAGGDGGAGLGTGKGGTGGSSGRGGACNLIALSPASFTNSGFNAASTAGSTTGTTVGGTGAVQTTVQMNL